MEEEDGCWLVLKGAEGTPAAILKSKQAKPVKVHHPAQHLKMHPVLNATLKLC